MINARSVEPLLPPAPLSENCSRLLCGIGFERGGCWTRDGICCSLKSVVSCVYMCGWLLKIREMLACGRF